MDTRSKILTLTEARSLSGPLAIAAGTFNPLRAAEAAALADFREQNPGSHLLVAILAAEPELLPRAARAELAAALRVVDYVVVADEDELKIGLRLPDHTQSLIDHVRQRAG